MAPLSITPIPCLQDNYAYLIRDPTGTDAWLVDPSELDPPATAIDDAGLRLRGILATHHHFDHTGGIEALCERYGRDQPVWVAGHARDHGRIPRQTALVDAAEGRYQPSGIRLGDVELLAMYIPGHTLGAIAWRIPNADLPDDVFTGDTLFAAGCGRLFEGTPQQMYASLAALVDGPDSTRLWFGHEYTATNLKFAVTAEPDNPAVRTRRANLPRCTTPTTIADENATNPFVRASTVEEFASRRRAKDGFRG